MENHFGYNQKRGPGEALLSLVVPVYNEEEGIREAYGVLKQAAEETGYEYEIVLSDNGSEDQTERIIREIAAEDPACKYVRLSRNFGYQINISVGMAYARGDAMIVIDSDLQDPPELIGEFLRLWREGYDIVYGNRVKRTEEPRLRIMLTMATRRIISWFSDQPLPTHSGDFRLVSRQVRDVLLRMPESTRYVRSMVHWVGFREIGVPYERRGRQYDEAQKRQWGTSVLMLVRIAFDAIFNSSLKPLRFFSLLGVLVIGISGVLTLIYTYLRLVDPTTPRGFATQTVISLIHLAVTSLGIGILGEYIGRIYTEIKGRPLWIVNYTMNVNRELPPVFSPTGVDGLAYQPTKDSGKKTE
ncbi:MAG: glycosyltransferase family 2 protein [Anaerolineae bacterium]|nr:glycosyltransferase family 2 protein [Anaerolineae bacterium]